MHKAAVHETHPQILKRLKRAEGQVRSIIAMIESAPAVSRNRAAAAGRGKRHPRREENADPRSHRSLSGEAADGRAARASIEEFKTVTKYL